VYKEDRTQSYDTGRASHTPFSLSHTVFYKYNKTHRSQLKYDIKHDPQKLCKN